MPFRPAPLWADPVRQADGHVHGQNLKPGLKRQKIRKAGRHQHLRLRTQAFVKNHRNPARRAAINSGNPFGLRHGARPGHRAPALSITRRVLTSAMGRHKVCCSAA